MNLKREKPVEDTHWSRTCRLIQFHFGVSLSLVRIYRGLSRFFFVCTMLNDNLHLIKTCEATTDGIWKLIWCGRRRKVCVKVSNVDWTIKKSSVIKFTSLLTTLFRSVDFWIDHWRARWSLGGNFRENETAFNRSIRIFWAREKKKKWKENSWPLKGLNRLFVAVVCMFRNCLFS